jgi:hypothetical protein
MKQILELDYDTQVFHSRPFKEVADVTFTQWFHKFRSKQMTFYDEIRKY